MVVGAHGTIGAVVSELVVGALSLDIELVLTLSHSIMGSHVEDKAQCPGVATRSHAPAVCWIFYSVQVTYDEVAERMQKSFLLSASFSGCKLSNPVYVCVHFSERK